MGRPQSYQCSPDQIRLVKLSDDIAFCKIVSNMLMGMSMREAYFGT